MTKDLRALLSESTSSTSSACGAQQQLLVVEVSQESEAAAAENDKVAEEDPLATPDSDATTLELPGYASDPEKDVHSCDRPQAMNQHSVREPHASASATKKRKACDVITGPLLPSLDNCKR